MRRPQTRMIKNLILPSTMLLVGGLAAWWLKPVPSVKLGGSTALQQPTTTTALAAMATVAGVETETSAAASVRPAEPPPQEIRQRLKTALEPIIKTWERRHARYGNITESDAAASLTVEIPAADTAFLESLHKIARHQVGTALGDELCESLLAEEFAEITSPRRIVALPRSGNNRLDRFEVFIPESRQPKMRTTEVTPATEGPASWMMSYSFTMRGNEPPEELRHLLRFAEE